MAQVTTTADVPDYFVCPITLEMMRDPIISKCGHMFDKEAIYKWLKGEYDPGKRDISRACPVCHTVLDETALSPCYPIKTAIEDYVMGKQQNKEPEIQQVSRGAGVLMARLREKFRFCRRPSRRHWWNQESVQDPAICRNGYSLNHAVGPSPDRVASPSVRGSPGDAEVNLAVSLPVIDVWANLSPVVFFHQPLKLNREKFLVGRHATCHGRITLSEISSRHCYIWRQRSGEDGLWEVFIEDRSTNGTYVNGRNLGKGVRRQIYEHDEIALGRRLAGRREVNNVKSYLDWVFIGTSALQNCPAQVELAKEGIPTFERLVEMSEEELETVGVTNGSVRRTILAAVEAWKHDHRFPGYQLHLVDPSQYAANPALAVDDRIEEREHGHASSALVDPSDIPSMHEPRGTTSADSPCSPSEANRLSIADGNVARGGANAVAMGGDCPMLGKEILGKDTQGNARRTVQAHRKGFTAGPSSGCSSTDHAFGYAPHGCISPAGPPVPEASTSDVPVARIPVGIAPGGEPSSLESDLRQGFAAQALGSASGEISNHSELTVTAAQQYKRIKTAALPPVDTKGDETGASREPESASTVGFFNDLPFDPIAFDGSFPYPIPPLVASNTGHEFGTGAAGGPTIDPQVIPSVSDLKERDIQVGQAMQGERPHAVSRALGQSSSDRSLAQTRPLQDGHSQNPSSTCEPVAKSKPTQENGVMKVGLASRASTHSMQSASTASDDATTSQSPRQNQSNIDDVAESEKKSTLASLNQPQETYRSVPWMEAGNSVYDRLLVRKLQNLFPRIESDILRTVIEFEKLELSCRACSVKKTPRSAFASLSHSFGSVKESAGPDTIASTWEGSKAPQSNGRDGVYERRVHQELKISNASPSLSCGSISFDDWCTLEERVTRKVRHVWLCTTPADSSETTRQFD